MELGSIFCSTNRQLLTPFLIFAIALLLFLEQISYLKKKRYLPGPTLVLPFIGNAISLVRNPTKFWDLQTSFAKSSPLGLSVNYVIGTFIVFIRPTHLSRKIFSNVRDDAFLAVGHPFGRKLFGERKLLYMTGQNHKDLRRRIAPNFTPKALSVYMSLQQKIILKHLRKWVDISSGKPIPLQLLARDLNLDTSQTVFVGPYLSAEARKRFEVEYSFFNLGLLSLPIDLPVFAFRKAKVAVERLTKILGFCAEQSKLRLEKGEEPSCLVDFWMQDMAKEIASAKAAGEVAPPHLGSTEVGGHVFDFLFAAQDASTSSLLWAVALLDSHPHVLAKVRDEISKIWSPTSGNLITTEQLAEMKYTQAVAREVLRYRVPTTMMPHVACEDFPLTDDYVIPKGTVVFPSMYESSFQGFVEADRFDPSRFLKERQEDRVFSENFLTFGTGAHQCVGQKYALNQLVLFVTMFSALIDFKRHRTEGCDEFIYNPTIAPKDGCTVSLSLRHTKFP